MINIFLILPESEPCNPWMKSNEAFQEEILFSTFVKSLKVKIESIDIENYKGFFDLYNVKNFLKDFNDLEEFYPRPAFNIFRNSIKNWCNWNNQVQQAETNDYKIFEQSISNHTFSEIAIRKTSNVEFKFSILNHYGHNLGSEIRISNSSDIVHIPSLSSESEILLWFSQNRIPKRNFHIIPKHGENRQNIEIINGKSISPLKCSKEEAQEMLSVAIGENIDELYHFDELRENFILFKYEGQTPQNLYHGFHLPMDTLDIADKIKKKLTN